MESGVWGKLSTGTQSEEGQKLSERKWQRGAFVVGIGREWAKSSLSRVKS